jgi:MFS family permease
MEAEKGRWLFVFLGMLINLCLGTVYAWSVFRKPLATYFSTETEKVTAIQTLWPFMLFLGLFAVLMPVGGKLVQRGVSPRTITIVGSAIVALGWFLSGYASSLNMLYITYGVIGGIGVGLAYGIPIAVSARWFPDKKGVAVGFTVLGFGLSALITAPLANYLITTQGVMATFRVLGIGFLIITFICALPLRFPAAAWQPAGWKAAAGPGGVAADITGSALLGTSTFYGLFFCFFVGSLSGLMAIGIASPVGQEIIKLDAVTAATLVSVFALFNGGGRPLFGWLTDALTPRYSAALSCVIILLASLGMYYYAGEGKVLLYAACFCAFWMVLGGWLAIAPTSTATFFGLKNYAFNYSIVFPAYSVGAIIGGLVSGFAKDVYGSYINAFLVTAVLGALGLIVALTLVKPVKTAS